MIINWTSWCFGPLEGQNKQFDNITLSFRKSWSTTVHYFPTFLAFSNSYAWLLFAKYSFWLNGALATLPLDNAQCHKQLRLLHEHKSDLAYVLRSQKYQSGGETAWDENSITLNYDHRLWIVYKRTTWQIEKDCCAGWLAFLHDRVKSSAMWECLCVQLPLPEIKMSQLRRFERL